MIGNLYTVILQAFGGNLSIIEIASLLFVLKYLIKFVTWLLRHFQGVLNDD